MKYLAIIFKLDGNIYKWQWNFEYIYLLRDETIADGTKVSLFRKNIGEILAKQLIKENPQLWDKIQNDNNTNDILVCGVPTSGITYCKSMAESLNLQYERLTNSSEMGEIFKVLVISCL